MGNLFSRKSKKVKISEQKPAEPTPAAPAEPAKPSENLPQDLLNAQNVYREKHQAPPMTLSDKLNQDAQKWADHIAENDALEHAEDRDGQGENLGYGSSDLSPQECADMWYNEIKDYDFNKPGFSGNTGHFTQLVWKASIEFGAGVAKSSSGATYIVGRYSPAGNVNTEEEFKENVLQEQ